jgi:hypothetical protein
MLCLHLRGDAVEGTGFQLGCLGVAAEVDEQPGKTGPQAGGDGVRVPQVVPGGIDTLTQDVQRLRRPTGGAVSFGQVAEAGGLVAVSDRHGSMVEEYRRRCIGPMTQSRVRVWVVSPTTPCAGWTMFPMRSALPSVTMASPPEDGGSMGKHDETKKLTLKRETLRVLTPNELRLVAGGRPIRNNCTVRLSGCIS